MLDDEIHIAFDRKNTQYVAYNVETNIIATGICVDSATDAYRSRYYEVQAENARLAHYAATEINN